jgi:hypothetical protein
MNQVYQKIVELLEKIDDKTELDITTDVNAVATLITHSGLGINEKKDIIPELIEYTSSPKVLKYAEETFEAPCSLWQAVKICMLIKEQWPKELENLINKIYYERTN